MKNLLLSSILILCSILTISAQAPESMNYQGVARDNQGNVLKDKLIGIEIRMHIGASNGNVVYQERHSIITNIFGIFNLQIGKGNNQTATFSSIDWGNNALFVEVLLDALGGTSFVSMGTQQLVSVPYALYSKTSGSSGIKGTPNFLSKFSNTGTSLGNSLIFDNGSNVGIGLTSPDDLLDVAGNSQVAGYLKVGAPTIPTNVTSLTPIPLYKLSYLSGTESWSVNNSCGGSSSNRWYVDINGTNSGVIYYNSQGSYNRSYIYSPWIWVPTGTSNLLVEATYFCNLENNSDGVFLEYITNGGNWSKINSFEFGGYPDNAAGCNTTCNGEDVQSCWNGINETKFLRVSYNAFSSNVNGKWIRFRFVGMEDASVGSYVFEIHGFNVTAFGGTNIGGAFASGNIYAEKNIYAGSNVLLGDVAEYFILNEDSEPGDLIAISPKNNDSYCVNNIAYNTHILGIHSTNPTVTLNIPNGTPVCLTGRVPVKVCLENGKINIGDYLTSASSHGYAMKASSSCFIIGRALENFDSNEKGKILCIAETGWYNSNTNSGGNFFLPIGLNLISVKDPAVNSNSRIFVSLKDNGGSHWISNIIEGSFTVNFEKLSDKNITFDYFIDNANSIGIKDVSPTKGLNSSTTETKNQMHSNQKNSKKIQLLEYSDDLPPLLPPDPKIGWSWLKNTGFVKRDIDGK